MILPKPSDATHQAWMYRLLTAIADDPFLTAQLRFKGGTYAAMRGVLDRFSVDLDFDLLEGENLDEIRKHLEKIFRKLGLKIKDKSQQVPQYFLKYNNKGGERNTLKLDISHPPPKNNSYEAVRFTDIDRILHCQDIPTMFANKLIVVIDRFEKNGSIAGRDIFDIHSFFLQGLPYKTEIIEERTGKSTTQFFKALRTFIEKKVHQSTLDEDLNHLMPNKNFQQIREFLKQEALMFLKNQFTN